MKKLRIVTLRFGTARQKLLLEDKQISNFRVVCVALGTGYTRVEGNRRASRNGRVRDLPPETANATIRCTLIREVGALRFGAGNWRDIFAEYHHVFSGRTPPDLKDKVRSAAVGSASCRRRQRHVESVCCGRL
jgi:hypothetical protein